MHDCSRQQFFDRFEYSSLAQYGKNHPKVRLRLRPPTRSAHPAHQHSHPTTTDTPKNKQAQAHVQHRARSRFKRVVITTIKRLKICLFAGRSGWGEKRGSQQLKHQISAISEAEQNSINALLRTSYCATLKVCL